LVSFDFRHGPSAASPLFDAILLRQSTRAEYDGRSIPAADIQTLKAAAAMPGVDLVLMTDRVQLDRVRDLVVAGNTAQMADAAYVRELITWLRFNPQQAIASGDGLFSATSGSPTLPAWLGPIAFKWFVQADAENDKYVRQIRSSAGVAVFVSEQTDHKHWVQAGRACQRFALQATALGLKHAFINQPIEVPPGRACSACWHERAATRYCYAVWLRAYASLLPTKAREGRHGLISFRQVVG
jgi:hypothetical protein